MDNAYPTHLKTIEIRVKSWRKRVKPGEIRGKF